MSYPHAFGRLHHNRRIIEDALNAVFDQAINHILSAGGWHGDNRQTNMLFPQHAGQFGVGLDMEFANFQAHFGFIVVEQADNINAA